MSTYFKRGPVTVTQNGDGTLTASLGTDLDHPETEIIFGRLHPYYIPHLIAALRAAMEE
jgi:hypothetical protein